MTNKRSCCCSALPKGLWWLLALLGLGLLYFLMLQFRQSPIEQDIQSRVSQNLNDANLGWANVNLDRRGRDVLLSGDATSEAERDKAIEMAKSVNGVRIVDDQINISGPLASSEVLIDATDSGVTLNGTLPDEDSVNRVVSAAKAAYGDNVINKLTISDQVNTASWLSGVTDILPDMANMTGSSLHINDSMSKLSGVVSSNDAKETVMAKAGGSLGDNLNANIDVVAPEPVPDPAKELAMACQGKLDGAMEGKKILFATNKSDIKKESHPLLDEIASVLIECKDAVTGSGLMVEGHTDSQGKDEYNQALSQKRADAVKAYLVNADVTSDLIQTKGLGESSPVASNDTAEGRAQNRRITFTINQ